MAVADVNLAGQSSGTDPQATAYTAVALHTRSGWSSESAHQQQRSSPQGGCRPQQPRGIAVRAPESHNRRAPTFLYPWMGTEAAATSVAAQRYGPRPSRRGPLRLPAGPLSRRGRH